MGRTGWGYPDLGWGHFRKTIVMSQGWRIAGKGVAVWVLLLQQAQGGSIQWSKRLVSARNPYSTSEISLFQFGSNMCCQGTQRVIGQVEIGFQGVHVDGSAFPVLITDCSSDVRGQVSPVASPRWSVEAITAE